MGRVYAWLVGREMREVLDTDGWGDGGWEEGQTLATAGWGGWVKRQCIGMVRDYDYSFCGRKKS
jgi:hypothetical protein